MSNRPMSHDRDLVLSDEEKLGEPVAYLLHEGMGNYALVDARDRDLAPLRRLDPKPLYRRPDALLAEVQRLRAAVKGHECLLGLKPWPAEFRPPLEPHEDCCPHPLIEHYPNGCGWCICKTAGTATDDPTRQIEAVRAAIEGRTSVNVSVILSALGEQQR